VLFAVLGASQSYFALFVAGILIADLFPRAASAKAANRTGAMLCLAGLVLIALPNTWFAAVYIGGATCLTAGAVFCAPVRRFFETRLSGFLGWISFPLYLVQAAVIYALAPRGLDLLAAHGLAPEAQRWILDVALLPIAIVCAIAFCPINDFAVTASRRFGSGIVAFAGDIGRRLTRRARPEGISA
jgi:peptidoglycan/LPS O-acetylase OafA/YrhL